MGPDGGDDKILSDAPDEVWFEASEDAYSTTPSTGVQSRETIEPDLQSPEQTHRGSTEAFGPSSPLGGSPPSAVQNGDAIEVTAPMLVAPSVVQIFKPDKTAPILPRNVSDAYVPVAKDTLVKVTSGHDGLVKDEETNRMLERPTRKVWHGLGACFCIRRGKVKEIRGALPVTLPEGGHDEAQPKKQDVEAEVETGTALDYLSDDYKSALNDSLSLTSSTMSYQGSLREVGAGARPSLTALADYMASAHASEAPGGTPSAPANPGQHKPRAASSEHISFQESRGKGGGKSSLGSSPCDSQHHRASSLSPLPAQSPLVLSPHNASWQQEWGAALPPIQFYSREPSLSPMSDPSKAHKPLPPGALDPKPSGLAAPTPPLSPTLNGERGRSDAQEQAISQAAAANPPHATAVTSRTSMHRSMRSSSRRQSAAETSKRTLADKCWPKSASEGSEPPNAAQGGWGLSKRRSVSKEKGKLVHLLVRATTGSNRSQAPGEDDPAPSSRARTHGMLLYVKPMAGRQLARGPSKGKTEYPCWLPVDPASIKVRGPTYSKDKKKVQAPSSSVYEPLGLDIFQSDTKVCHLAQHVDLSSLPQGHGGDAKLPQLLIVNCQLPLYSPPLFAGDADGLGLNMVLYFGLRADAQRSIPPHVHSLLQKFVNNETERVRGGFLSGDSQVAIRDRLKLVVRLNNVEEAPLSLTERRLFNAWNEKPVLTRPQHEFFQGSNYLEVDIDVHRFAYPARKAFQSFQPNFKSLVYDVCLIIQGNQPNELPEHVLCCMRVNRVDISSFGILQMET